MKRMSRNEFVNGWITMWGLAYIVCAFIKPDIYEGVTPTVGFVISLFFGGFILGGLGLIFSRYTKVGRIILFIAGVLEVVGGVASWAGVIQWNVPFQNKELFNVSMSFADLISAVFLFSKVYKSYEKIINTNEFEENQLPGTTD